MKKHTHKKTNKHTHLNILSAIKKQRLSNKRLLGTSQFKDLYTDKTYETIEAHLAPLNPMITHSDKSDELYEKQMACLSKLKQFALMRTPTAIRFYNMALINNDYFDWLHAHINGKKLCEQLIVDAKEVALCIKDPLLLIDIYEKRIKFYKYLDFLDLEDAYFCLKAAAEMDDASSSVAAYMLACLCMFEFLNSKEIDYLSSIETIIPDDRLNISRITKTIYDLFKQGNLSAERAAKNLKTLCNMGSQTANKFLHAENEELLKADVSNKIITPKISHLKELCTTYFNLALKKTEEAPAEIFEKLLCKLHTLIKLKVLIEETEKNFKGRETHYQDYYNLLRESAAQEKMGAMYAIYLLENERPSPNQETQHHMLNKILSLQTPNHIVTAHASHTLHKIHMDSMNQEQAARFGNIFCMAELACEEFEKNNLPKAMEHFKQIKEQAHLFKPDDLFYAQSKILANIKKSIY